MFFRAVFWVGLVAVLMPHEPDLGLGRPVGIDSGVPSEVAAWTKGSVEPGLSNPCRYNAHACATTNSMLDTVKAMTVRSLSQVKADIAENREHRSSGS